MIKSPLLEPIAPLIEVHASIGQELFDARQGQIFPCDALIFAVLDRSLSLINGFDLLISNGGYAPAVALVRMQLDSVLRLYGVITSGDAHSTAQKVMAGTPLRKITDKNGERMTDKHLVTKFKAHSPWVDELYDHCSGFIHLSSNHIAYFLFRGEPTADGRQAFAIGDEDEHISENAKRRLANAFNSATKGLIELVSTWPMVRDSHGTVEQLKSIYAPVPPQQSNPFA